MTNVEKKNIERERHLSGWASRELARSANYEVRVIIGNRSMVLARTRGVTEAISIFRAFNAERKAGETSYILNKSSHNISLDGKIWYEPEDVS